MQNSVQQYYLPESYPIIPLNIYGNPWKGEESHQTGKSLLISSIRKIPLNKFTSSAIKSAIPSPIK